MAVRHAGYRWYSSIFTLLHDAARDGRGSPAVDRWGTAIWKDPSDWLPRPSLHLHDVCLLFSLFDCGFARLPAGGTAFWGSKPRPQKECTTRDAIAISNNLRRATHHAPCLRAAMWSDWPSLGGPRGLKDRVSTNIHFGDELVWDAYIGCPRARPIGRFAESVERPDGGRDKAEQKKFTVNRGSGLGKSV